MSRRINRSYVYIVVLFSMIVLAYSVWIIASSVQERMEGKSEGFYFGLIAGVIGIGLALSSLLRLRGKLILISREEGRILTVIECPTCNIKTIREFQRGDYVNKRLEKCPKCEGDKVITSIYMEKPAK